MTVKQYFAIHTRADVTTVRAFQSRIARDRFCADNFHFAKPASFQVARQTTRPAVAAARAIAKAARV